MHGLGRLRTHGCMQVLLPVCMVLVVMCVPIPRYKLNDVECSMGTADDSLLWEFMVGWDIRTLPLHMFAQSITFMMLICY